MNLQQKRGLFARLLMSLLLLAVAAQAADARDIVGSVDVFQDKDWPEIYINLNTPMHYLSHTPRARSDTVQIMLRPVLATQTDEDVLNTTQTLPWDGSGNIPLSEVAYDGTGASNPWILLKFERPVEFTVRSTADRTALVVTIGTSPGQKQTAESGQRQVQATPAAEQLSHSWVINLQSSLRPIDTKQVPRLEIFRNHQLYTARFQSAERVWYRLRLGFFATPEDARKVMEQLRPRFSDVWIGIALEEEKQVVTARAIAKQGTDSKGAVPQPQPSPATPASGMTDIKPLSKPQTDFDLSGRFALNLESSLEPIRIEDLPAAQELDAHILYITSAKVDGRLWHGLRLGFFPTKQAAQQVADALRGLFPRVSVVSASWQERAQAGGRPAVASKLPAPTPPLLSPPVTPAAPPLPEPDQPTMQQAEATPVEPSTETAEAEEEPTRTEPETKPLKPAPPGTTNERLAEIMEEARQAMAGQDYSRAVALYTKVLQFPDNSYSQDAQEFLALARERKGQLAHAKAEYEKYLERYPEGEAADRVRQRLAGLVTARDEPQEKLREAKRQTEVAAIWDYFGGFSQFYRRDANIIDQVGEVESQSALSSDFDGSARRRGAKYLFNSRLTGGLLSDFLVDRHIARLSSVYFDLSDLDETYFARAGRQSRSTGGVLGRFDGGLFGYGVGPVATVNLVTGYPVDSTENGVDTTRVFYGLSTDLGTFADAWDFVAFVIEQRVGNLIDRRALGGEVRYFDPQRSMFGLVDYDVFYSSLNNVLLLGNWSFDNSLTLNGTIDYRNSPVLTTRNAIQGQLVTTVDELRATFTDEEIFQLAEDRTPTSHSATLGASYPLNEKFQISGDITVSSLSDTPASGGVEAIPGSSSDIFVSTQLIGSSLIKQGDISILSLRYSTTTSADTISLSVNTRYPMDSQLRINPRFRVDYRQNQVDNSNQWTISPQLRIDYRWRKRFLFEVEAGGEWSTRNLPDTDDTTSYFFSLGYRYDF